MSAAPYIQKLRTTIPALAATTAGDQTIGKAPFAGTVTAASFTPEADITGNSTNTRTLTIVNKGQDGNGTTVIATLALTTGVNLTDFNEQEFMLSAVEGATTVAEGDVLAVVEAYAASGLANPGGSVEVTFSRS